MVVNGRPLKRAKRRVTADLYDFLTFPTPGGEGISNGPFRSNIGSFLARHARLPPPPPALSFSPAVMDSSPHLVTWRVAFRIGEGGAGDELGMDGIVEMDVVEEDVMKSRSVYCDQCRVVGWSGNPVCRKRYHFIIRNDNNPFSGYHQKCARCGSLLHMLDSRCMTCKYEMTAEDFEDWAYQQLEDSTHLLHGVVHANGYGHLLRVNGKEGGSKYLTGCDIMGFWDRLCKLLRVRKVTVMDISKKFGMEYRLLHAVTDGRPWYGNWGYEFGSGSYALTLDSYRRAVESLSRMPLSVFSSHHSRSPRTRLQNTIALYWALSDRRLETVRDLFCFITRLLHESHEHSLVRSSPAKKMRKDDNVGVLCAWTRGDVEAAEGSMVKVLRAVGGGRWVSWQALRGATCRAVASLELLDYCLKDIDGKVTDDGMVVAARCNPENSAIEYRLEAASNQPLLIKHPIIPAADQLLRDLRFLYDALLNPTTMNAYKPTPMQKTARTSAAKLLDCKQFIKNYDELETIIPSNPIFLWIWCHVELVNQPDHYTAPPAELLVLPVNTTVAELKLQATKAFRDTYLIFQSFKAEQLLGYGNVDDGTSVKLLLGDGNGSVVKVRGRCFCDERGLGQFRMERGLENWVVDCACGARDDDGERMLACDACGVWQHTRCAGISDYDRVPVKFVCKKCSGLNKIKARGGGGGSGSRKQKDNPSSNVRCKDEVASSAAAVVAEERGFGRMTTVG